MKPKKNNMTTMEQFKDKHYGKRGTEKRDKLEAGYESFKIGALIYEARISTLQRIVELGLGGHLQLSIKL